MKNVKCARCVRCGKEYEAVPNLTNCSCGGILDIEYDYDYIKPHFTKEPLKNRVNPPMWRYRELLPVKRPHPTRRCAWAGARCMKSRSWRKCWVLAVCGSRTTASTRPLL